MLISNGGDLLGIVMLARLLQLSNPLSPRETTLFGIVTPVRLAQPAKAEFPIFVTLPSIVTLVRLPQSENILSGMPVMPVGMVMPVKLA